MLEMDTYGQAVYEYNSAADRVAQVTCATASLKHSFYRFTAWIYLHSRADRSGISSVPDRISDDYPLMLFCPFECYDMHMECDAKHRRNVA